MSEAALERTGVKDGAPQGPTPERKRAERLARSRDLMVQLRLDGVEQAIGAGYTNAEIVQQLVSGDLEAEMVRQRLRENVGRSLAGRAPLKIPEAREKGDGPMCDRTARRYITAWKIRAEHQGLAGDPVLNHMRAKTRASTVYRESLAAKQFGPANSAWIGEAKLDRVWPDESRERGGDTHQHKHLHLELPAEFREMPLEAKLKVLGLLRDDLDSRVGGDVEEGAQSDVTRALPSAPARSE